MGLRFLVLALAALATVPSAAGEPVAGSKTIGTRGSVTSITADGGRVAIGAELRGKNICQTGAVWTPATGSVVHLGGDDCFPQDEHASRHDALTIAGTRVAWVDYEYGNHAYCDGPYTATLAAPKPVAIASDCDGTTADVYFGFLGDGDLLVMTSSLVCEVDGECTDDNGDPLPEGEYDVTVSRIAGPTPAEILPPIANRELLDVNRGRVLVWEPPGNVVVYSARGAKLASFPTGKATLYDGRLDGDTVVFARGTTLTVASIAGKPVRKLSMARGGRFRDLDGGLAVYTAGSAVHLLRLSDGRDRVAAKTNKLIDAELEPAGLFYAANSGKGSKPGRVTFVPRARL